MVFLVSRKRAKHDGFPKPLLFSLIICHVNFNVEIYGFMFYHFVSSSGFKDKLDGDDGLLTKEFGYPQRV